MSFCSAVPPFPPSLPPQVRCVEMFKDFYATRTNHRCLTWIYSLGSCNVVGHFTAKPIELIVTTYQVRAGSGPTYQVRVGSGST